MFQDGPDKSIYSGSIEQRTAQQKAKTRTHKHFFRSSSMVPQDYYQIQYDQKRPCSFFLHRTGSFPPRIDACRSEATNIMAFLCPSNAPRGPGKRSAPVSTSKSSHTPLTLTMRGPLARSKLRRFPYETLRSSASLSTVSRTV